MRNTRMAVAGASVCALLAAALPLAQAAEEETAGNNLSVPLLWSEAAYPPPIDEAVTEQFAGKVLPGHVVARDTTSATCDGALQKDVGNLWQADASLVEGGAITTVDWGDNLEAMDPNLSRAYTRVEVGLYQALTTPATGYDMCWISGRGQNEVWGAQVVDSGGVWKAVTSPRSEAMVYTAGARLTIQRIVPARTYTWNASTHRWDGTGSDVPFYSGALHEGAADGPGSFGAEITVSGKLSYGYLWDARTVPQGEYRLTFSLDSASGSFPGSGTSLAQAAILASEESSDVVEAELSARAEGSGNSAVMRGDLNVTYLDVTVGTRTDPIPTDEPTPPPPSGGGASGSSDAPPAISADPTPQPVGQPSAPPVAGGGQQIIPPALATALMKQTATIRAAKQGTYPVGRTLVLAARPVKTDAGVTVRWTVRSTDKERCRVRTRDGRSTVTMLKPGTCGVIGWAPAPSPEYEQYRWTRTYRVTRSS